MVEYPLFKDVSTEQTELMSFKEKVEWIGKWVRDRYNFISVNTLHKLFLDNFGWDLYKRRYAVQLLATWGAIYQVTTGTFVVNKNWRLGKFGGRPVFATKEKMFSIKELKKKFPEALVFKDSD